MPPGAKRLLRSVAAVLAAATWVVDARAVDGAAVSPVRVVSQTVGTDEMLIALADPGQIAALSKLAADPEFSAVAAQAAGYPRLEPNGDAESVLRYRPTLVLCANYSRAELVTPARVIAPSVYGAIPGADTTFQDLCDHAGAINLAATLGHLRGHAPPPVEQMLTWPVDEVVLGGWNAGEALAPFRQLSPYEYMDAVKSGRVALVKPYQLSCVSFHRVDGYEALARALHPGAFP